MHYFFSSENFKLRVLTTVFIMLFFLFFHFFISIKIMPFLIATIWSIALFEWLLIIKKAKNHYLNILTPIYIFLPLISVLDLYLNNDFFILFYLFFATVSNDVGAYFIGNLLGKLKLAEKISPKKTIEGFFGGFLSVLFFSLFFLSKYKLFQIIFISFAIAAIATIGDLFESYAKRCANLKDSGTILPGHGGVLDRIDGFVFVASFFYIFKITYFFCH